MTIVEQDNLQAAQLVFRRYLELTRKTPEGALTHRTRETAMELYQRFHDVRPKPGIIASSAAARQFTIRRQPAATVAQVSSRGVSVAALNRAENLLAGAKSGFFKVTKNAQGTPVVRPAMVGVRNSSKLLKGGRRGNKFAVSARSVSSLTGEQLTALQERHPELKKLNLQALSVAIELAYRARAGAGGTLGLQFLHKVYQRRSSSTVKRGPLVSRTRQGIPIGEVTFIPGADAQIEETHIIGSVPGSEKVNQRFGIVSATMIHQTADMLEYINKKLAENAKSAGLK